MNKPLYRYYFTVEDLTKSDIDLSEMFPDDPILSHLFTYISGMYGQSCILTLDSSKDTPPQLSIDIPKVENRIYQFVIWVNTTKDYYEPLIKAQQDNLDNILADANVKSLTKFNDAPMTEGEYEGNDYISTITSNVTNVPESVRAKLAQIQDVVKDYYGSWLKDFERNFIYVNVNLDDTTEDF